MLKQEGMEQRILEYLYYIMAKKLDLLVLNVVLFLSQWSTGGYKKQTKVDRLRRRLTQKILKHHANASINPLDIEDFIHGRAPKLPKPKKFTKEIIQNLTIIQLHINLKSLLLKNPREELPKKLDIIYALKLLCVWEDTTPNLKEKN